jgi:acetyltransferase-like isoleucine patch superfamily enzyme
LEAFNRNYESLSTFPIERWSSNGGFRVENCDLTTNGELWSKAELSAMESADSRKVAATFGQKQIRPDPGWEVDFAAALKDTHTRHDLLALFARHRDGEAPFDILMRRVLFRALCKRVGHGLQVGPQVVVIHPETMEFGDCVFIGAQSMLQGRFDGTCIIGNHVWIGPHAYFDARNLLLDDYVGWGPGAKVLGSVHTGDPVDIPIIATDLVIEPVRVGYGADIGTNATILPGVRIGANSIVGAGAVVTEDVPDYTIVAGVPARILRSRMAGVSTQPVI